MKFLVSTIFVIALVAAGWRYAPQNVKTALLGAVGIAARGSSPEIKHFLTDVALPKDPAERRQVLENALEKNIAELKTRIADGKDEISAAEAGVASLVFDEPAVSDTAVRSATSRELISSSERIIADLAAFNKDTGIAGKITERILDVFAPKLSGSADCPVK